MQIIPLNLDSVSFVAAQFETSLLISVHYVINHVIWLHKTTSVVSAEVRTRDLPFGGPMLNQLQLTGV